MGSNTKIEWADHTFNPWVGCSKVSPACDNCYAETWAKRAGTPELWDGERRRTTVSYWKQPLKWNKQHDQFYLEHGHRQRVFCASLADIFDNQVPDQWRHDFWQLVRDTPNLDWMLLTKRPQNIKGMLPTDWKYGYPNVWLGLTVENQKEAERKIPVLIGVHARVKFLSIEPPLGAIDLDKQRCETHNREFVGQGEEGEYCTECAADGFTGDMPCGHWLNYNGGITWVITGGETGSRARPSNPDWFRSIRDQCQDAGVAFFFKQFGEWAPNPNAIPTPRNIDHIGWFTPDGFAPHDVGAIYRGEVYIVRSGKNATGRLLDGRTWTEFPEVQT